MRIKSIICLFFLSINLFSQDTLRFCCTNPINSINTILVDTVKNDSIKTIEIVQINDSIRIIDSIKIIEIVKVIDSIKITDSIRIIDSIRIVDSIKITDSIRIIDSVKITDSIIVNSIVDSIEIDSLIKDTQYIYIGVHSTWGETALHGTIDYLNSQFIVDLGIRYTESKTQNIQGFYRFSLELSPFESGRINYGPRISYSSFNHLSAGLFVRYRFNKFESKIYYNKEFKILFKYYL